jgi:hypothetical protein
MQAMAKGAHLDLGPMAPRDRRHRRRRCLAPLADLRPEPFLALGIDVRRYAIVALKSSNHFRAGFKDVAAAIVTADPPGLTAHHIEIFPRRRAVVNGRSTIVLGTCCAMTVLDPARKKRTRPSTVSQKPEIRLWERRSAQITH